jgi:dipeptidyl aminopeptidase/acylaminoacyl peptidase
MPEPRVAPFGAWKSPITSDLIVSDAIGIGQLALDGDDVYWLETRPTEGGRGVVVRRTPDGQTTDVTPPPFNVRTRVHEYGGGAFAVADGIVYFSNFEDQRLYRQEPGGEPHPLTPELDLRYADGDVDRGRGRMVCVREDHTVAGQEATNTVVSLDLDDGGPGDVIVSGSDFYSTPRISPDGSRMAWLSWDHPNMPWDGTQLWTGELDAGGAIGERVRVAGGPDESIFQPEWSPDGSLYFVSDRSGWWNLYRWLDGEVESLCQMEAEFGAPQWGLGMRTYGFASAERIICSYTQRGVWHIADFDTGPRTLRPVPTPFTEITRAGMVVSSKGVVFGAGSPTMAASVMYHELAGGQTESLRRTSDAEVDDGYVSAPRSIEFPTERGLTAHAFFYPPKNRDYAAPEDKRPPLLVMSHGGPTGTTSSTLNLNVQYWTSRGIAVLDVNYGGSSGYGTEYRRRLNGQWGVVDIDDCVNGATYLVERGEVDGERLAIKGGSAGGYTTLSALTFRDVFKAGASYYGISDLEAMTRDTHKFESRYLDSMIGPYPERRDLYIERSPIHHTDGLSCPIILFQGLEDRVVPPNQAEMMVDAMRKKGLPVAYVPFEGEQHGFRRAENIKRALEAELYFYSRVFGFDLADPVEPVDIENL